MSGLTPEQIERGICLAHKLIPSGLWPASSDMSGKSLLLTCVRSPLHDGPHVCGDMSWAQGAEDDIDHLRRQP